MMCTNRTAQAIKNAYTNVPFHCMWIFSTICIVPLYYAQCSFRDSDVQKYGLGQNNVYSKLVVSQVKI